MRRILRTFLLLVITGMPALAGPQQRYEETVDVTIVEIDVVVTDRKGNPVRGLTKDDFEIFEGRQRQEITQFAAYENLSGEPTEAERSEETAEPPERNVMIVLDASDGNPLERKRLHEGLERLIESVTRSHDRVGIVQLGWTGTPVSALLPTSDREAIVEALERFRGRNGAPQHNGGEQEGFFEEIAQYSAERNGGIDQAAHRATSARLAGEASMLSIRRRNASLQRVIDSLRSLPGRRLIVIVSNDLSLPFDGGARVALSSSFDEVGKAANAAGVTIYGAHPRSPNEFELALATDSEARDVPNLGESLGGVEGLEGLAKPTGGLMHHGPRAFEQLGSSIARDVNFYYSLGYRDRTGTVDRERRVIVRSTNPSHRVRARQSHVVQSSESRVRQQLLSQLFVDDAGDLTLSASVGDAVRAGRNRWDAPVKVSVPVSQLRFENDGARRTAAIALFVVAGGDSARSRVSDERLVVLEPAGGDWFTRSLTLRLEKNMTRAAICMLDQRTGLSGCRQLDLTGVVPD